MGTDTNDKSEGKYYRFAMRLIVSVVLLLIAYIYWKTPPWLMNMRSIRKAIFGNSDININQ